jgi:hypothetical protein
MLFIFWLRIMGRESLRLSRSHLFKCRVSVKTQMHALTTDRHSVQEWHRLFTALRVVRFEGDDEFEDVKRRATKKLTIGAALPLTSGPRFAMKDHLCLSLQQCCLGYILRNVSNCKPFLSRPGRKRFASPFSSGMRCAHILLPLILNCQCFNVM